MSSKTQLLHQKAMENAERAFNAKNDGDNNLYRKFINIAYKEEKEAALRLLNKKSAEPTRSILFRGAISLAIKCNEYQEAAELTSMALDGNPPLQLKTEIENLYKLIEEKINQNGGSSLNPDSEKIIISKDKLSGKKTSETRIQIFKDLNGEFHFRVLARNGKVILKSNKGYSSVQDCKKGLSSFIQSASSRSQFESKTDTSSGKFYFIVKSSSGKEVAKAEGLYDSYKRLNFDIEIVTENITTSEISVLNL